MSFILPFDNTFTFPSHPYPHAYKPWLSYLFLQLLSIVTATNFNIIADIVSALNKFNINLHKICTDSKHKENYNVGVIEM